jgi:hypothetical protein
MFLRDRRITELIPKGIDGSALIALMRRAKLKRGDDPVNGSKVETR